MSPARFFVDAPLAVGETIRVSADVAHHALRVLRLRSGDAAVLFNGLGGEYAATLRIDGSSAMAQIDAFDAVERESPLALTLIQALVAADKLDWIVEKAIELGAQRIVITPMQRCVVRLDTARRMRRLQHWRDIARAACCQCGRNRVPAVDFGESFDAALATAADDELRFVLVPAAAGRLPGTLPGGRATLMVGPEGGLSADEQQHAESAGFVAVRLGPRVLRTETAGLAALASLQALSGDLVATDQ